MNADGPAKADEIRAGIDDPVVSRESTMADVEINCMRRKSGAETWEARLQSRLNASGATAAGDTVGEALARLADLVGQVEWHPRTGSSWARA